ncbi:MULTISPECIES: triose-phosphate isomerase [Rhodococcus]|jgi:triosephosphate isomerase|uniref:Triosephosphate isomerase n=1 Tax=Rhodococcus oxybenzonivorans TaxID=1990687 RepID=A0A2S2BVZ8_9NOCA|nr:MULTISPECIES: triose-phosphate isomerase [Rhodococcus]AWK72807.1 triose-phosphate isomerase [Rhodococcus oxybenzonivorans]MDV7242541.1 triose-phosphate isomerase [Rhodococcus oxybenzonivorans]MDV7265926.1 triose-phosphate isomerase [Rhodococcus oxybenzonivorans]MDV7275973.1 triose-phosphate isomerase [Rhodococcus oxybenzonivorans]MDV7332030.1 triose-phosphate isomerase [Rhodococcus oxybenzonivorans]
MARKPLIAGNWKMNLNHFEAIALVQKIAFSLPDKYFDKVDVTVLPPFTDIRSVQTLVEGDKLLLTYGAQDVSAHDSGAFTGEISGSMLAKLGCTFVVVGHSERRTLHGEDNDTVLAKTKAALKNGLTPIVCIGEGLNIREAGEHVAYNVEQLRGSLAGLSAEDVAKVVIAYEPVWAIGTGRVASASDAQEVCAAVRAALGELATPAVASTVRVLYGGSVNAKNVGEIVGQSDVDGALVGGASLKADEFATLSAIAAGGPLP